MQELRPKNEDKCHESYFKDYQVQEMQQTQF